MLSIRRISILLRAEGLLMYGPARVCCYTITQRPEIECADDADDCDGRGGGGDGSDDIGPPCTPLTSLSARDEE